MWIFPYFWVELKDYHNVFQPKFDFTPWIDTSFSPTSSARSSFSKRSSCRVKAVLQIYHGAMASNCSGLQVLHATNPGFFTNPRFWRNLFYCQTSIKLMSNVYSELKVFGGNMGKWEPICNYDILILIEIKQNSHCQNIKPSHPSRTAGFSWLASIPWRGSKEFNPLLHIIGGFVTTVVSHPCSYGHLVNLFTNRWRLNPSF